MPIVISDMPVESDLIILGAGPAGLTAAIYAERAGLKSVVIEKGNVGGQIAITPVVENYPGFTKIAGKSLVDLYTQQALQYVTIHISEEIRELDNKEDRFHIKTNRAYYIARGLSSLPVSAAGNSMYWGKKCSGGVG